jgi:hypothetical protein
MIYATQATEVAATNIATNTATNTATFIAAYTPRKYYCLRRANLFALAQRQQKPINKKKTEQDSVFLYINKGD